MKSMATLSCLLLTLAGCALDSKAFTHLKAYRTSAAENVMDLGAIKTKVNTATVAVQGQSITTFFGSLNTNTR